MSTAISMQPAEELVVDDNKSNKDVGWDPFQVWKEQVGGDVREPMSPFPCAPRKDTWSPYEVWMQHVARK